jgi:hypothetical protein
MKLLLAVDTVTTLHILIDEMLNRSWPSGTAVRVLSIVEDDEVPLEAWREEGSVVESAPCSGEIVRLTETDRHNSGRVIKSRRSLIQIKN